MHNFNTSVVVVVIAVVVDNRWTKTLHCKRRRIPPARLHKTPEPTNPPTSDARATTLAQSLTTKTSNTILSSIVHQSSCVCVCLQFAFVSGARFLNKNRKKSVYTLVAQTNTHRHRQVVVENRFFPFRYHSWSECVCVCVFYSAKYTIINKNT